MDHLQLRELLAEFIQQSVTNERRILALSRQLKKANKQYAGRIQGLQNESQELQRKVKDLEARKRICATCNQGGDEDLYCEACVQGLRDEHTIEFHSRLQKMVDTRGQDSKEIAELHKMLKGLNAQLSEMRPNLGLGPITKESEPPATDGSESGSDA